MDGTRANRIIVMSAVLTYGLGFFNSTSKGKLPSMRFIIGAGVVFVSLSALADVEPELAAPLALAVVTTSFFSNGTGVMNYLNAKGEVAAKPPPKKVVTHRIITPAHDVGQIPGVSH